MPWSNRIRLSAVQETTLGVTPNTPRMREKIITGEQLSYTPVYETPAEIRSDRMTSDPVNNGTTSGGSVSYQLQYPVQSSPEEVDIQSAYYNAFVNTAVRDNDGNADSIITQVTVSTGVVTVTAPAGSVTFAAGQLVRMSGFGVALNNGVFKATAGTTTSVTFGAAVLNADEAAPPGTARAKVVGFYGASGDISATATGLASIALDFTTLGLQVGGWVKIGGTATSDKFATAALNSWARITAVAAHAITLDNLPSGWTTDGGSSKTIKVWFGDHILNGTTQISQTIERGHLGQGTPTYLVQAGLVASQYSLTVSAKRIATVQATYVGTVGSQSTTTLDASPDAAPSNVTYPLFSGSSNVARIGEAGVALSSPNWVSEFTLTINNNAGQVDAIDSISPVDVVGHECTVTARLNTYFGDNSLLTKFFNGTATSLAAVMTKGNQAMIVAIPRLTYTGGGSPNATSKNQIIMLNLDAQASKDTTVTNALVTFDRLEYFET